MKNIVNPIYNSLSYLSRLKTSLRYYFYLGYNAPKLPSTVSPGKVIIRTFY